MKRSSAPTTPGVATARWWSIHVIGELDVSTAPDLQSRLDRAAARHPDDGIVLDLAGVRFVDCAGLGPILRERYRRPDAFWLRGLTPRVMRLLELTDLASTLPILPPDALWPVGADPGQCHVVLDCLPNHRPPQPRSTAEHRRRRSPGPQGRRDAVDEPAQADQAIITTTER